eukprot:Colp12_sorted_trinity150504_noHs@27524
MGPQTEEAIEGLRKNGRLNGILVPIAFTSDHIETLFELDHEYVRAANEKGMNLKRARAFNDDPDFIKTLADIAATHLKAGELCSTQMPLRCPMCVNETCGKAKEFFNRK